MSFHEKNLQEFMSFLYSFNNSSIGNNNNLPSVSTENPAVAQRKRIEMNYKNKPANDGPYKKFLRQLNMANKIDLLAKERLAKDSISVISSTPKVINTNNNNQVQVEDFDCSIIEETKEIIIIDDEEDEENNVVNEEKLSVNEISDTTEEFIIPKAKEQQSAQMEIDNNFYNIKNSYPETTNDILNVTNQIKNSLFVNLPISNNNFSENKNMNLNYQKIMENNKKIKNDNKTKKYRKEFNDTANNLYNNYTILYETITSEPLNSRPSLIDLKNNNDSIICLDDDSIINDISKNINKSSSSFKNNNIYNNNIELDDSIIFVSESINVDTLKPSTSTKALDFIPLSVDSSQTPKSFGIKNSKNQSLVTPLTRRIGGDLFTNSEHKQILRYNTNAYNPNKNDGIEQTGKRMVLIDGSNVAFHHALNKQFSVKGLEICLEYFEKMGHDVKAIVPQFRLQSYKSTDPLKLETLHSKGKIVFTPCKNLPGKSAISYDDRFILQLASELDAAVVSNDNYRDLINENPAFKKIIENRVIGYTWCNDLFILPKDPYGRLGPHLNTILNRIEKSNNN